MKRLPVLVVVLVLLVPRLSLAQSSEGLAKLVPDLFLTGITLPGGSDPGSPHAGHFTLGNPLFGGSQPASQADAAAIRAIEAFGDRFRSQIANVPLGSSSGGLTYVYDSTSGTHTRRAQSFGPAFTERAITIGRGKSNVGFTYQHSTFDDFAGEDLRGGAIRFYLPHTDCCSAAAPPPSSLVPGFEGDLVEAKLDLKASNDTFAFFGSYGVTDRLDIGVAIPIVHVSLDARVHATIIRLSSEGSSLVHTFVQGQDETESDFANSGSATGIGDIVLRSKYNFWNKGDIGMAAGLDLRLPTGKEEDLLGLGTTQAKLLFIVSSGGESKFSPHFNFGYTISGKGNTDVEFLFEPLGASDEVNYAGGVEFIAHPRLTIVWDYLGRTLIDAGKIEEVDQTYQFRSPAGATAATPLQTSAVNPLDNQPYRQLELRDGSLNQQLMAIGAKYNPRNSNVLLTGNLLFQLNKAGLRDQMTFTFGFDWAF